MTRVHCSIVRLPPGKDSFAYHSHRIEEEWIYMLSGRAVALIDGEEHEVGPGDFMGFAQPSPAHLMKNPFAEEAVYLMGGEFPPLDVVDYPELKKKYLLLRGDGPTQFYELGEPVCPFGPAEE